MPWQEIIFKGNTNVNSLFASLLMKELCSRGKSRFEKHTNSPHNIRVPNYQREWGDRRGSSIFRDWKGGGRVFVTTEIR